MTAITVHARVLTTLDTMEVAWPAAYIEAEVRWARWGLPRRGHKREPQGKRFFHVRHDDGTVPAISELIEAPDLKSISAMVQKMGSYAAFATTRTTLALEVWSDVDTFVESFFMRAREAPPCTTDYAALRGP